MLLTHVDKAVRSVENRTHKLLLIGREGSVQALKEAEQYHVLNLSIHLATQLLPLSKKDRCRMANRVIESLISEADSPVVLDRIEVLFDPSLELQPLQLLKQLSRSTTRIVLWPGSIKDSELTYAQPMQ